MKPNQKGLKIFSSFLNLVLIFQFVIGLSLIQNTHAQVTSSAGGGNNAAVQGAINEAQNDYAQVINQTNPFTQPTDGMPASRTRSIHIHTQQFHRVYDVNGNIVAEYDLARIDISNPYVVVNDMSREIRFAYSPAKQELEVQKLAVDKATKKAYVSDAHVFKNINITSNIAMDGTIGTFATDDGVHAFLTRHLQSGFCNKILVTPVVIPPKYKSTIKSIVYQTPELAPGTAPDEVLFDGDLVVTFVDGFVARIKREEVVLNLGSNLLGILALVQAANPDMDNLDLYQKIFKANGNDLAEFLEAQRSLLDGADNDLIQHALRALGQKLDYNELGLLFEKNGQGQNQFEALAASPRNAYTPDTWTKYHDVIRLGQEDDAKAINDAKANKVKTKRTNRGWRQILVDHLTGKDAGKDDAEKAAFRQLSLQKKIFKRIAGVFKKVVTRNRIGWVALALTGVGVNHMLGDAPGEWAFEGIIKLLNTAVSVPLVNQIASPIQNLIGFLGDSDRWIITRMVAGAGLILAFNPLSYLLAKMAAVRQGLRGWSPVRAFFTFGAKFYGKGNYPFQKLLIWDRLRQKNLYSAVVDNRVNPLQVPQVFNKPNASAEDIKNQAEKVNGILETDAARRGRAMILAAAIVSNAEGKAGNEIDIASLIMLQEDGSYDFSKEEFTQFITDPVNSGRWSTVTQQAYSALVDIGDNGGEISASDLAKYVELYKNLAQKFKKQSSQRVLSAARNLFRKSKNLMSRNLLPFILYGKQWYEVSRQFSNIELPEDTLTSASHAYNEDYFFSDVIYMFAEPGKFADSFGVPFVLPFGPGAPEIITNQLSQVFVYGVQGAIDPPNPKEGLANPYAPITNDRFADQRKREQTMGESAATIANNAVDAEAGSFFGQHASVMQKLFDGYQIRFMADFFTRTLGLYLTMRAINPDTSLILTALKATQLTTFFLMAKISFQYGVGGFAPGYATIWPYIQMSMAQLQGATKANLAKVQYADYLIASGIELNDLNMVQKGVARLQDLYKSDGKRISAEYNVNASEYTMELAQRFHAYSLKPENVPLATKVSERLYKGINQIGAIVSTVLYAGVSAIAMNPKANAGELLLSAVTWFGITYGGMKVAEAVAQPVAKAVNNTVIKPLSHKVVQPVAKFIAPVTKVINEQVLKPIGKIHSATCELIFGPKELKN